MLRETISPATQVGWLIMLLLAIAVAGYAGVLLMAPELRPPLVRTLFAEPQTAAAAHFLGGAIALVAGALQVNTRLRARFLQVHRLVGRVYVVAVIFGGMAGLALAMQSMGGFIGRTGFALLCLSLARLHLLGLPPHQTPRAVAAPSLDDPQLRAHARSRDVAHLSTGKFSRRYPRGARIPCDCMALLGAEHFRCGMVGLSDAPQGR